MVPVSSASGAAVDQESCSLAATGQWEFRIVDSNDDFELYNPGTRAVPERDGQQPVRGREADSDDLQHRIGCRMALVPRLLTAAAGRNTSRGLVVFTGL
jgi:hypothetical protein